SKTRPRIGAGVLDHCANPRLADATARSRSSAPERGNRPITSFQSAGLRFSKWSPVAGATHSPAMKFLNVSVIGVLRRLGTKPRAALSGIADAREHDAHHQYEPPDDE